MPKGMDGRLLWRRRAPLLACLLVALAVAGCGDSSDSDSAGTVASRARRIVQIQRVKQDRWTYARAVFNEMCAGCHTLADAGARGRRFNLDHSSAARNEPHVRSAIAEGEPGMPAFGGVLAEREYEELVAYIVAVARDELGDDYWHDQIMRRIESGYWSPEDTEKLERYARRIVRERFPRDRSGSDG